MGWKYSDDPPESSVEVPQLQPSLLTVVYQLDRIEKLLQQITEDLSQINYRQIDH